MRTGLAVEIVRACPKTGSLTRMQLLTISTKASSTFARVIVLCALSYSALVAASLSVNSAGSSRSGSASSSPLAPRCSNWARRFKSFRPELKPSHLAVPEPFTLESAQDLLNHLAAHPKDIKKYNEGVCASMDGQMLKAIIGVSGTKRAAKKLLNKSCMKNIPAEAWSVIAPSHVINLNLSVSVLPARTIPYLIWNTFKASLLTYMESQMTKPSSYSGWCKFIRPKQFSREIWTGNLWHILSAECIADMERPKSQLAAIRLIAEKDLTKVEIGRPDLLDLGLRLVRLLTITRMHSHTGTLTKAALSLAQNKIKQMTNRLGEILEVNKVFLQRANRTEVLRIRIGMMQSIMAYNKLGSSDTRLPDATNRLLQIYGDYDPVSLFTWEILSKMAVQNASPDAIELISDIISIQPQARLPLEPLISECCSNGSTHIIMTIISSTHSVRLLKAIGQAVRGHRKAFGKHSAQELLARLKKARRTSVTSSS